MSHDRFNVPEVAGRFLVDKLSDMAAARHEPHGIGNSLVILVLVETCYDPEIDGCDPSNPHDTPIK